MSLTDFFRINLPYGMTKNSKNEWFAFNREYMPLGWNSIENQISIRKDNCYGENPVYTNYKGLTDVKISKIIKEEFIHRDENNNIIRIYFYDDKTNPKSNTEYWSDYFKIIKEFSKLENKSL